ncbi:MAG: hypothetical protein PHN56_01400 [Candidatus Nanoarchaeia archaeon]|nr:hypothetical protein [Candidatus Nanoarchaeia archaeon]
MKKAIFLAFILLFIGNCYCAQNANKIESYIEINDDLSIVQRINFTMQNEDSKNLSSVLLLMPFMPQRFDVIDSDSKLLNYSTSISNGIFVIIVNDIFKENSQKNYIVRIYDSSVVTNFGDSNVFSYNFLSYYNLESFNLKLILPHNYAIISNQGNAINPLPNKLYSSNEVIIMEWNQKLGYLESKSFLVFFEKISGSNSTVIIIILTFISSFIIGAVTIYLFFKKSRSKTLTQVLSKDEKAVVDLLIKKKDLTQKDIGEILDLSKPKLSKLIQGLSRKSIIEIIPEGRKNKIILKKEIL